jgi:hypothetical protein
MVKDMKIIPAIRALRNDIIARTVTAGPGLGVERTPRGTRIYLEETPGGGGGAAWHGMFEMAGLVDATTTPGTTIYKVKVFNGNDLTGSAGIAHVNRQPFTVAVTEVVIAATGARHYVYLEFTPPVEATDTTAAVAAAVVVVVKTALMDSTDAVVYHLIGQAWVENSAIALSQDHIPGNVYMDWYGPCIGLLEGGDDTGTGDGDGDTGDGDTGDGDGDGDTGDGDGDTGDGDVDPEGLDPEDPEPEVCSSCGAEATHERRCPTCGGSYFECDDSRFDHATVICRLCKKLINKCVLTAHFEVTHPV